MPHRDFICPRCKSPLRLDLGHDGENACANCGYHAIVTGGVPVLLANGRNHAAVPRRGAAESTFRSPALYVALVKLKNRVYRDTSLDISDYVVGKSVLDVGCGPDLNLPHMESPHPRAASYVGIDSSLEFVLSARRKSPGDNYAFAQASVTDIPFPDKSFDTTVVSYVIHHVAAAPAQIMRELLRVTRSHLVIFDHLRADNFITQRIQDLYWRVFDGGCNYMTRLEWEAFLAPVRTLHEVRTGAIFRHVLKIVCAVPD